MKATGFPKIFGTTTSTSIITDKVATLNNIKLLLGSEKYTLFGDPYYGVRKKYYMFEQNGKILKDVVIDEIYTQIKTFIPQVRVERKDIDLVQDKDTIRANIRVTYLVDYTQETYSLVLFKED